MYKNRHDCILQLKSEFNYSNHYPSIFNFFIGILNGNLIDLIMYNAMFYLVVAVLMIVINPKRVLYGTGDINSKNEKY